MLTNIYYKGYATNTRLIEDVAMSRSKVRYTRRC